MDKTAGQYKEKRTRKKHPTPWLKPYQFKKGVSGNPTGAPKGSGSLKVFAKNYFYKLSDEEKVRFLNTIDRELVWKMAEGNPHQTTDVTSAGEKLGVDLLPSIRKKKAAVEMKLLGKLKKSLDAKGKGTS